MPNDLDRQISIWSESVVRAISRRRFVNKAVKSTFAILAGLAAGTWVGVKDAFAVTCTCDWYDGSSNANCPKHPGCNSSPPSSCPSGCSLCTSSDYCLDSKGYYCNYSGGYWISCTGLGQGGGFKYCLDCKCPNCSYVCTCLSECICCNCSKPAQVEAEMHRLQALFALS
jgi:hypothetical protein